MNAKGLNAFSPFTDEVWMYMLPHETYLVYGVFKKKLDWMILVSNYSQVNPVLHEMDTYSCFM